VHIHTGLEILRAQAATLDVVVSSSADRP
jgi:hypothetical protein